MEKLFGEQFAAISFPLILRLLNNYCIFPWQILGDVHAIHVILAIHNPAAYRSAGICRLPETG